MTNHLAIYGNLTATLVKPKRDRAYILRNQLRPAFWIGFIKTSMAMAVSRVTGYPLVRGSLRAFVSRNGQTVDLGILSYRVVTTAGVVFLVDAVDNGSQDATTINYHACGTDNTPESVNDVALGAEITVRTSRVAGLKAQSIPTGIDYTATQSFTGPENVVEHGLFSDIAGGVLWDRSVFATIAVTNGDSIQWVYSLVFGTGG